MITEMLLAILAMLLFLALKGFFSGSEIALVNADKIKLRHRAKQGHRGAELSLKLLQAPDVLLSTTLVGTNICTVVLTTIGALLMIRLFGELGEVYAFLILTPLLLVLGEIVPKSVYQQKSDRLTPIIIYPLRWASYLFYPVVFVFSRVARLTARLAGAGKREQPFFITREQLRMLLDVAEHGPAMDAFGKGRIRRVIRFAETTVAEAMIPIAEATAISRSSSTATAVDLVRKHGYNRLPVFESSTSNIVGIVTLTTWDLMDPELRERPLESLIKPALYVSPLQTIDQLLPVLRRRPDHMAIVVDEFGTAIGMITMEDIVEEVVGEIDVGYDFEEYLPKRKRVYEKLAEEVYLMDSRLSVSEANEVLAINLPTTEFHTVGGLVLARLRHIPEIGEYIGEEGYRFTVVEASDRAILRLRVEPEHLVGQADEPV
ncbi:MAG: hemolysin family protein [Alphaproteobacteria bacterium]|nr:hemolysin family protein [Alphaproteobacteria bacterium]